MGTIKAGFWTYRFILSVEEFKDFINFATDNCFTFYDSHNNEELSTQILVERYNNDYLSIQTGIFRPRGLGRLNVFNKNLGSNLSLLSTD